MARIPSSADIERIARQAADSVGDLVAFGQTLRKVRLGSEGDGANLNQDECKALIWGVQLLREGSTAGNKERRRA